MVIEAGFISAAFGTVADLCFELCFFARFALVAIAVSARLTPVWPSVDPTMTAPLLAAFALVTTSAMALTTSVALSVDRTTIADGRALPVAAMTSATECSLVRKRCEH